MKKKVLKPFLPTMDLLVGEIKDFAQKHNISFAEAMSVFATAVNAKMVDDFSIAIKSISQKTI